MDIRLIPLEDIDDDALPRDRVALDTGALWELRCSISAHGLRMPVEVFPIEGDKPWGLVSGFRRLAVFRELAASNQRYAAIPAFVRQPETLVEALVDMVEENAVRAEVSPWEQGLIAVTSRRSRIFDSVDAAIATLYASYSRQRQHRLRSVALVAEELEGLLTAPETLSLRQLLRIAAALTRNYGALMRHALEEASNKEPEAQWRLLLPILVESETADPVEPDPIDGAPTRPRRTWQAPLHSLRLRRELTPDGWCLHFTGRDARGDLMDLVIDHIERMLQPDNTVTRSIPKPMRPTWPDSA